MKLEYIVNSTQYKTVKEVLKAHFHISDRLLLKLKRHHQIFINGKSTFVHTPLHFNDIVSVDISFHEKSENIVAVKFPLQIIFEDEALLIINKPANLSVHPSMAHFSDSLSNGLQSYFEKNNIQTKIRPVNRLDKNTSRHCYFRQKRICARTINWSNGKSYFSKILFSYFIWNFG